MTIEEFIAARLDEDERIAKAAADSFEPDWHIDSATDDPGDWSVWAMDEIAIVRGPEEVAEHIARHDPARVLRQVAMLRAMLDHATDATGLDMSVDNDRACGPRTWPYIGDLMRRDIAAIWSDHSDFQPEWSTGTAGSKT